ncbi:TPA: hypothetical protein J0V02_002595 [Enterococcus faecium]|nr:hypothetical protein [Enterococcus faecium]
MANIQTSFIDFHNSIRLDVEDNTLLKDYKDQVIDGLKDYLPDDVKFETFLQGSYSVYTGIKSCDEKIDFDIDIAVAFEIDHTVYEDPREPKLWVKEALVEIFPNAQVNLKVPCLTATFTGKKTKKNVHVDVAVYAKEDENYFLAKAKEFSAPENRCWEEADPKVLKEKINSHVADSDDRKQFRRCIRYLKRWKDNNFNQEYKPTGIGLTINVMDTFLVNKSTDFLTRKVQYNDMECMKQIVSSLKDSFVYEYSETDGWHYRLHAYLPVKPNSDTYSKMTVNQMSDFKNKLSKLYDDLIFAIDTEDEYEATKRLNNQFGEDFLIISEEEVTEKNLRNAFVTDYPSA